MLIDPTNQSNERSVPVSVHPTLPSAYEPSGSDTSKISQVVRTELFSRVVSPDAVRVQRRLATVLRDVRLVADISFRRDVLPKAVVGASERPGMDGSYSEQALRLRNALVEAFEREPLEDGMEHPAESVLDRFLSSDDPATLDWLQRLVISAPDFRYQASLLRCLARRGKMATVRWRNELVREALAQDNLELRDAAVQAVESWADREFVEVLRSHQEPVAWLREYIQGVLQDLEG